MVAAVPSLPRDEDKTTTHATNEPSTDSPTTASTSNSDSHPIEPFGFHNYELLVRLHTEGSATLWSGRRHHDSLPVLVKLVSPSTSVSIKTEIAKVQYEYNMMRYLHRNSAPTTTTATKSSDSESISVDAIPADKPARGGLVSVHDIPIVHPLEIVSLESSVALFFYCSKAPGCITLQNYLQHTRAKHEDGGPLGMFSTSRPGGFSSPSGVVKARSKAYTIGSPLGTVHMDDSSTIRQDAAPHTLGLEEFSTIAINIAKALEFVHSQEIVHCFISLSNIMINPATLQVWLGNFTCAVPSENMLLTTGTKTTGDHGKRSSQHVSISLPELTAQILARMSPELCKLAHHHPGHRIDTRSDLYQVGVALYELLTGGVPPFTGNTTQVIHGHVALEPPLIETYREGLPLCLRNIISRLLMKDRSERYQSAFGLRHDLEEFRNLLLVSMQSHNVPRPLAENFDFVLGRSDMSTIFQLPDGLFGRDNTIEMIVHIFDKVANELISMYTYVDAHDGESSAMITSASSRCLFISVTGRTGVGKTALVKEAIRAFHKNQAALATASATPQTALVMVSSKFHQMDRTNVYPYFALISCVQEIVQQLIGDPSLDEDVAIFNTMCDADKTLLLGLVPNAKYLVSNMSVKPLRRKDLAKSEEAKARFQSILLHVLVVMSRRRMIILFLDDIQWSDQCSIDALQKIVEAAGMGHIVVVCAYRSDDVDGDIAEKITTIHDTAGSRLIQVQIDTLAASHVQQFIGRVFGMALTDRRLVGLSDLLFQVTDGNPYYFRQLLIDFYRRKLIWFDWQARSWMWKLVEMDEELRARRENVVEFTAGILSKLSSTPRKCLSVASCIGTKFTLDSLVVVLDDVDRSELMAAMETLHGESIIESVGPSMYAFMHDNLQQAAYTLVDETQRASIHLRIGLYLMQCESTPQTIFDAVSHFDQVDVLEAVSDVATRRQLRSLYYSAAVNAKGSGGLESAKKYILCAVKLLSSDGWTEAYAETWDIYSLLGEVEIVQPTTVDSAYGYLDLLDKHARHEEQRLALKLMRLRKLVSTGQYPAAVEFGYTTLRELGIEIEEEATVELRDRLFKQVRNQLDLDHLQVEAKEITDPRLLTMLDILKQTQAAGWVVDPLRVEVVIARVTAYVASHGTCNSLTSMLSIFALYYLHAFEEYEWCSQLAHIAFDLSNKYLAHHGRTRDRYDVTFNMSLAFVWLGGKHVRASFPLFEECLQSAYTIGDVWSIMITYICLWQFHFFAGTNLDEICKKLEEYRSTLSPLAQANNWTDVPEFLGGAIDLLKVLQTGLHGRDPVTWDPLEKYPNMPDRYRSTLNVYRLFTLHLLGYSGAARQAADENVIPAHNPCLKMGMEYFRALIYASELHRLNSERDARLPDSEGRTAEEDEATAQSRSHCQNQLDELAGRFQQYEELSPINFAHQNRLVQAEVASLQGDVARAMDHYQESIRLARKNGFTMGEAQAYEHSANFYLKRGILSVGIPLLHAAADRYSTWGSVRKPTMIFERITQLEGSLELNHYYGRVQTIDDKLDQMMADSAVGAYGPALSGGHDESPDHHPLGKLVTSKLRVPSSLSVGGPMLRMRHQTWSSPTR